MIKKIVNEEQLDNMESMIWRQCARFSLHDFCEDGGFSEEAFQDYCDLAKEGLKIRMEKAAAKTKRWSS